jgi:hypothetical protein
VSSRSLVDDGLAAAAGAKGQNFIEKKFLLKTMHKILPFVVSTDFETSLIFSALTSEAFLP